MEEKIGSTVAGSPATTTIGEAKVTADRPC
jgi:hypothetical protein